MKASSEFKIEKHPFMYYDNQISGW